MTEILSDEAYRMYAEEFGITETEIISEEKYYSLPAKEQKMYCLHSEFSRTYERIPRKKKIKK